MNRMILRTVLAGLVAFAAFGGMGLARPNSASAHPLGNFTISTATRIELYADAIRIHYAVDMAEIPAFQEIGGIDRNGDGAATADELDAYLDQLAPELARNLRLSADREPLTLTTLDSAAKLRAGEGGLSTLRLDLVLDASAASGTITFEDRNYTDRLGWREVTVVAADGVPLTASDAPSVSASDYLAAYPEANEGPALRTTAATFAYRAGIGARAPEAEVTTIGATGIAADGGFGTILSGRPLTLTVVLVMLVVAMGFGAVHALEPGHGKTIVAAYFVGTNGRASHAALLGIVVAATHSVGVLVIGAVTLYGTRFILPEDLYPWLTLASGVMVVALGVGLLASRLSGNHYLRHLATGHLVPHRHDQDHRHGHGHHHEHPHPHGGARRWQPPAKYRITEIEPAPAKPTPSVPWKSLTVLGLIDGLIPTPSTLVVLLSAISIGQFALGMALVVAFSVGLAAVLSSISLVTMALKGVAGRFHGRRPGRESRVGTVVARAGAFAPPLAALALIVSGSVVVFRATSGTLL